MDPITITMGIMALVKGGSALMGGLSGAKKAKVAGKEEAAADLRVTQEKIFQSEQEQKQLAGQTRAMAAGSGIKADIGSPLTLLAEQERTFERERQFTKEVGAERAGLATRRASMVSSQTRFQGFSQAAGSAVDAFGIFKG